MKTTIASGIDNLENVAYALKGRRIGLMTNPTGTDAHLRSTIDILHATYGLSALFGCEHGVRGDAQAGEHVEDDLDAQTGVPVYSVFGETQRMTEAMLDAFDVLVFDMQDVGARFYTYLYSLSYAMEACAKAGKPVVVLDRVNPLGGVKRAGTVLEPRFASFVGDYELPTQTGLTIGEYAQYARHYLKLDMELHIAKLSGWRRHLLLDDLTLPWVAPSPNCPSLAAALVYPGTCIFESCNVSEGRGTTQPFELIGAPWIDDAALERRMATLALPGIHFRRASFKPVFSKHAGTLCHGVQLHVVDRSAFDACHAALALMDAIRAMHPKRFEWVCWDEGRSFLIDLLLGTDDYRLGKADPQQLMLAHAPKLAAFSGKIKPFLLYE